MPTRNTIVVPCMVNISLYCDAVRTLPFGPASWSRISSASIPAITIQNSEMPQYMMPMRLWSTVVNQLHAPVVDIGRRMSAGRRRGGARVPETVVMSLQRQEVVGEDLCLASGHGWELLGITIRGVLRERRHT